VDLMAWVGGDEQRVVLLTLIEQADWRLLARLCRAGPPVLVVAVLPAATLENYVRAVSLGAAGAVPRATGRRELREAVLAVSAGKSLLPHDVVQALAHPPEPAGTPEAVPSATDLQWLRDLADGLTVGRLADRAGYSERMMFRRLRDLYGRVGAGSRAEALFVAKERGWI
jgi:DNA-binding NarL/FixJ family response regulator